EATVVGLQDRILGREIERPFPAEAVIEAGVREVADRRVEVVHPHGDARAREVEYIEIQLLAVIADPLHGQLAGSRYEEISRAILIAEGMAADHDRIGPAGNQPRYVRNDDRLAEDTATENVADGAVG